MRRANRIVSRPRLSPEMDDATIQNLKDKSRKLQNEAEDKIIKQFAPHIIPAMAEIPDQKLEMSSDQRWSSAVPVPLDPDVLTTPLPLPRPQPDLAFGYSKVAFTRKQLMTIDLLVDDQFGKSYAVPDQQVRFPFLQIEFKSQAKNGTHYIATNQAAGAGAIALNGNLDLIQRSFGLEKFDYEEPRYFSVTIDHQLACVNVHWLRASAEEGGQHSFHVEGLSKHLLDDEKGIRAVSRAIKNIFDYGVDAQLRTLCEALDAYRETVIRNRNAANASREPQPGYRSESHTGQQGRRGVPPPKAQAETVASYEEVRTSRPPVKPVRPVNNEQRSRRGAPAPEVQVGENIFPKEKVRNSQAPLEPLQPLYTKQRPQRVQATTRRQVQIPVAISARVTRLSCKRSSRIIK